MRCFKGQGYCHFQIKESNVCVCVWIMRVQSTCADRYLGAMDENATVETNWRARTRRPSNRYNKNGCPCRCYFIHDGSAGWTEAYANHGCVPRYVRGETIHRPSGRWLFLHLHFQKCMPLHPTSESWSWTLKNHPKTPVLYPSKRFDWGINDGLKSSATWWYDWIPAATSFRHAHMVAGGEKWSGAARVLFDPLRPRAHGKHRP